MGSREWSVMEDLCKWGLESGPLCRIWVSGVSRVVRYVGSG